MKKIHRVSYGDMFGREFRTKTIDRRLNDLELDEKLMIIDNLPHARVNTSGSSVSFGFCEPKKAAKTNTAAIGKLCVEHDIWAA